MSPRIPAPLVVNGWTLFAHPLLLDQIETLTQKVESLRNNDPVGYSGKNATKRLAAIRKLTFQIIPQDPSRPEYRQGKTLGTQHKHWFRAKFYQQYRLFFRYHSASKIIVYGWVNDSKTLRSFESKWDAYRVFRQMLENGNPPEDWESLLAEAKSARKALRGS